MEKIKKLLAKEFIWLIAAFVFAFPLALVPLVLIQTLIKDYQDFITRIDNQVVILYLIFVIICFIGLLIMRFTSSVIKILFISSK